MSAVVASMISVRLCGGMLAAMPTAMAEEPPLLLDCMCGR